MDIKQGMLGNCYFLAGLAALSERPDRIFNLFLLHEQNPQKYYSVKILYRGKWKRIDLDEYVPVLGKNLIFSRSNQNETWVIMMEKAWAKLYGSYKQT
jgi:calpain-15